MSHLLKAEFLRLASRRLTWFLLLGVVALAALVALTTADQINPDRPLDQVSQQSYEQNRADWEQFAKDCGRPETSSCADWPEPRPEDYGLVPISYSEYVLGGLMSVGTLALIAGAVLSSSLIGAEYVAGTMATQLTFTPRRTRLMAAKVIAAVAGSVGLMFAFMATSVVVRTITFLTLRGADELHADVELPQLLGRMLVLALLIGALSAGLTVALGSSLLTAGVLTVVLVGSFIISGFMTTASPLMHVLPSNLLGALLMGGIELSAFIGDSMEIFGYIGYGFALACSIVAVGVVLVVAAVLFRRRDLRA